MYRFCHVGLIVFVFIASGSRLANAADNWPQWRGPLGTGVAADGDYPVKFSADEGVAWRSRVAGEGFFDTRRVGRSDFRDVRHR